MKLLKFILLLGLAVSLFSCKNSTEKNPNENSETKTNTKAQKSPAKTREVLASDVNVPNLADKSANEFEKVFGVATKIKKIENNPRLMPGEFREYKVSGHPKGLSVRFYKGKAKRFNLLLGKTEKSARDALNKIFKIDVGRMQKAKVDTLSETWKGKFRTINYKTVYAKRNKSGGDFVMLHAEVAK